MLTCEFHVRVVQPPVVHEVGGPSDLIGGQGVGSNEVERSLLLQRDGQLEARRVGVLGYARGPGPQG